MIFNRSPIFAETLEQEQKKRDLESRGQKARRKGKRGPAEVKMGHGGTLDPMASTIISPRLLLEAGLIHFIQLVCWSPVFLVVPRCCNSSSVARKLMSVLRSLAAAPIHTTQWAKFCPVPLTNILPEKR